MLFLTPRYLKEGRALAKEARRMLSYKRDLWTDVSAMDFAREIDLLEGALKTRDRATIEESGQRLDTMAGQLSKAPSHSGWRENVEVFLVAIVIALGVRTYFIQPFGIPTGSMQPTLNGIIGTPTQSEPPNILVRTLQKGFFGRDYLNVVARTDETLIGMQEQKRARFFTYTHIQTDQGEYSVNAPAATLRRDFELAPGRSFKKGEIIARGHVEAGDHVFVDKFTYNFRKPHRGEVFVFSTLKIPKLNAPGTPSQFYIKRIGGVPGDRLRIDPPTLFVNDTPADEFGIKRVMSGTRTSPRDGYRGYGNGSEQKGYDQQFYVDRAELLGTPNAVYTVPPASYYALGDNSYNSLDSRFWGTVPERNVMGRAMVVYWPFGKHSGIIR